MRQRNYILILFTCLLCCSGIHSQNAAAYFASMPGDLIPELEPNRRKDLIDLYQDNQKAAIRNNLNGLAVLEKLSSDYLLLQTDSSRLEIILLTMINDSKMLCTIETRCAPVCDSRIAFYTVDWKKLDSNLFITPVNTSYFLKEDENASNPEFAAALTNLDIELMEFRYDPDTRSLAQIYNTPRYLANEEYKKVKPFLKEAPYVFRWKQIRFE